MSKKRNNAFTLVELLVSMAIIAILISLSIFGISTAQRVLRDDQRRKGVEAIVSVLQANYGSTGTYPTSGSITISPQGDIKINSVIVSANNRLKGPALASSTTTTTSTVYCYRLDPTTGYIVGAKLEDGNWFYDLSVGTGTCDTTGVIVVQ